MPHLEKFYPHYTSTEVKFDREASELLGIGLTEGTVSRIKVRILGEEGRQREISLAEKFFDSPASVVENLDLKDILKNHEELKKRGLPTFPTMRVEKDGERKSLYMTDLTAGGRNEVFSAFEGGEAYGRSGKFRGKEVKFQLSNSFELSAKVAELYRKATKEGCILRSPDIPFLVLNKSDKRGRLIFGDITDIDFIPNEVNPADSIEWAGGQSDKLEDQNYWAFSQFIWRINSFFDKDSELNLSALDKEHQRIKEELRGS